MRWEVVLTRLAEGEARMIQDVTDEEDAADTSGEAQDVGAGRNGGAGRSPLAASGPIPFHVAFVDDRLLCAVNPRWGYARRKFRKIRFRFLVAGRRRACLRFFGK